MRRILYVTTVSDTLRAFLLPFASHFRALGFQVDAMAQEVTESQECQAAFDRLWGVTWSRNPLDPRNLLAVPFVIRKVVQEQRYDIVHVHTPVAAFVTRWALRDLDPRTRPVIIYTAHGFHFHRNGKTWMNALFLTLERLAGRWTDYLVVINREDQAAATSHRIVPPERLRYMPGIGVSVQSFSPDAVAPTEVEQVRAELGLGNHPLFLMIAEFTPNKRHRDALVAFSRLGHRHAHLAFAGVGPLEPSVRQLASELGVSERVHLLGFRRDIRRLIRSSMATLLISEREGLPRSVMESLCLEVPVIGTDTRGTQDLLVNGGGRIIPLGDVEALAQAMTWVIEHPEEAREMGRRGRQLMKPFDLENILGLHEDLYREALEARRAFTDS